MLKRQVAITPPPQWVRVIGGFTEHQFAEKRLPTIEELNAVGARHTCADFTSLRSSTTQCRCVASGRYTKDTPEPRREIVRDANAVRPGF